MRLLRSVIVINAVIALALGQITSAYFTFIDTLCG